MSWTFYEINTTPQTEGEFVWRWKEKMVVGGWVVARSGDGLAAFSNVGDVLLPGGPYASSGAGSLDNTSAWFELKQPVASTPRRSFLVQKTSTAGAWRIWYSSDGTGFTGGAPNSTTRGTAADEQGITNTPSGTTQWLPNVAKTYRMAIMVGGAAEAYSFAVMAWKTNASLGTDGFCTWLALDVLDQAAGTDADPAVVSTVMNADSARGWAATNAAINTSAPANTSSRFVGWYNKGGVGANFVSYPAVLPGATVGFGFTPQMGVLGQRPDNKLPEVVTWFWRGGTTFTTERGRKGRSKIFRATNPNLNGFRLTSDRTRLAQFTLTVPWDGSTIPLF